MVRSKTTAWAGSPNYESLTQADMAALEHSATLLNIPVAQLLARSTPQFSSPLSTSSAMLSPVSHAISSPSAAEDLLLGASTSHPNLGGFGCDMDIQNDDEPAGEAGTSLEWPMWDTSETGSGSRGPHNRFDEAGGWKYGFPVAARQDAIYSSVRQNNPFENLQMFDSVRYGHINPTPSHISPIPEATSKSLDTEEQISTDMVDAVSECSVEIVGGHDSETLVPRLQKKAVSYRRSFDSIDSQWSCVEDFQSPVRPKEAIEPNTNFNLEVELIQRDPQQRPAGFRQQPRRPFQDQRLREETKNTRNLGACVRCRMQKIRCNYNYNDPSGICQTCQKVSSQKIYNLPCLRYRISECRLYRAGKGPGLSFSARWNQMKLEDINKWAAPEVRTIRVQADICPDVPFELTVRKFVPIPEDSLHRSWMDGETKKFKATTPYAIVNMRSTVEAMRSYITQTTFDTMEYGIRESDELVKITYAFARKYMNRIKSPDEEKLLGNYFRLWAAARRTITTEHIIGEETLEMSPELEDRSYPLFGKVPLPPVMIQQLDMILILGVLDPLQKKVLEDLQRIVMTNKPTSWMTIYLITFFSMVACSAYTNEQYKNARKQGLRRRYSDPKFISDRHNAANVFLAYYHYCTQACNPFTLNWKRRQATPFADWTPEDIVFIKKTEKLVKEREDLFQAIQEEDLYEHELYFVGPMYHNEWKPRETVVDYDGGLVDKNQPLKKRVSEAGPKV